MGVFFVWLLCILDFYIFSTLILHKFDSHIIMSIDWQMNFHIGNWELGQWILSSFFYWFFCFIILMGLWRRKRSICAIFLCDRFWRMFIKKSISAQFSVQFPSISVQAFPPSTELRRKLRRTISCWCSMDSRKLVDGWREEVVITLCKRIKWRGMAELKWKMDEKNNSRK